MLEKECDKQSYKRFQELEHATGQGLSQREFALIRDRLANLPHIERMVIYLLYWEEKTVLEIAHTLGLQKKKIEKIINKVLTLLSKELAYFENKYHFTKELTAAA
ncbi:MAG: hypothetical protein H6624_15555 [Bdellovibrionaceae bacterium]|nr:hypothetical protein [Pseudobdellovibrionaceae bacterium]